MKKVTKTTPSVRFNRFTVPWKLRKFSELYRKSSEKNDGSIGMDKNITVATMQYKDDVKVSTQEYLKTYYTFNVGDIAFEGHHSKEFKFGRFVENDIGDGIVSHIFMVFRPVCNYDICFWKYAINNERVMQKILSRSTKASTMMHDLVTNDFLNESIFVPCIEEQKDIGFYLRNIEKLITLYKQKLEQQKKIKKYFLQNMFPAKGEKVPKIRMKGFIGDWKEQKINNVIEVYTKKTTIEDQYPVLTSSQQKGIILQNKYFSGEWVSKNGNVGYFIIPRGYFAYRSRSDNDVFVFNRNDAVDIGIISYFYPVFKPKGVDSNFLLERLNYGIEKQIMLNSEGTGQHVLSLKKFKNISALFPSYEEQKLIGCYFQRIEKIIELYQCKLDEICTLKKYMIQNMFI
ncbi:restriction endonuclease subunit S [uncultured Mitsuokella sp.]|uniref:restriction endonuclease subunit S n=1 Tax=Mitsuokella jalaludinii TaxID=187979 RepID=UPI002590166D|nr:restriction endonuclease subunit S [uncultured Mitsuokella sp.]